MLWGLSNLVIEPDFSPVFFTNKKLAQRVLLLMQSQRVDVATEASYVFTFAVKTVVEPQWLLLR